MDQEGSKRRRSFFHVKHTCIIFRNIFVYAIIMFFMLFISEVSTVDFRFNQIEVSSFQFYSAFH